jgi:hypothetical protein
MSSAQQKVVLSSYTAALYLLGTMLPLPVSGQAIAVFFMALFMMHLRLPLVKPPVRGSAPQPTAAPIEPPKP